MDGVAARSKMATRPSNKPIVALLTSFTEGPYSCRVKRWYESGFRSSIKWKGGVCALNVRELCFAYAED